MSIIKNGKNIIGVYRGSTPISKIFKHNNLVYQLSSTGGTETPYDIDIEFARANERGNSFKINGTVIRTTDAYYKGRLKDLGFDKIESFSFNTSLLTKINAFPSVANVKKLEFAFNNCTQLTEIPNLDYPNNVNCSDMFNNTLISTLANISPSTAIGMYSSCPNLTEVDVFHRLNNASDVAIFIAGCTNLTKFTFGVNDIAPTNLFNFFYGDTKLSVINDIGNVKLDNANDISGMFHGCSSLTDIANINFGNKPTSSLYGASDMFNGSGLDLTTINQANYPVLYNFFTKCTNLTNVSGLFANSQLGKDGWSSYNDYEKLGIFNNAPIEDCSRLFQNTPIRYIDLGYSSLSTVTDCSEMFSGCYNLERVSFDGIELREDVNYSGMFQGCSNLNEIQFNNTPSCTSVNILKAALEEAGLTSQVTFNFSTGEPNCGGGGYSVLSFIMNDYSGSEYRINGYSQSLPSSDENELYSASTEDMRSMAGNEITSLEFVAGIKQFVAIPSISTLNELEFTYLYVDLIDLSKSNLNNLTRFDLYSCSNLKHIDLSNWTSFNLSEYNFFSDCSDLKSVKMLNCCEEAIQFVRDRLSENGIDAVVITEENNTYLSLNFEYSPLWYYIDGNSYTTESKVTDLSSNMYDGCSVYDMLRGNGYLKTVYTMPSLSGTTSHYSMFNGCSGLLYQDLSTWDFDFNNGDQDINSFFNGSSSLVWVNFSGWNLTNSYNYESMFYGCEKLKYVFAYGCNDDTISKLDQAISHSGYSINLVY